MTEDQKNQLDQLPIELNFTVKDVNSILEALSNLPFGIAAPLIKLIQDQGVPQCKKHEEAITNLNNQIMDVEVKT